MTPDETRAPLRFSSGAPSRDAVIDIARGVAIMLVLVGHSVEMGFSLSSDFSRPFPFWTFEIWRLIYAFHMPAFFFFSGMAFRIEKADFSKIAANSLSLIAIAYGTSVAVAPLIHYVNPEAGSLPVLLLKPLVTGYQMNLVVTWFLVSLAFCQILSWLVYRRSAWLKIAAVAVGFGAFLAMELADKNYYYAKTWIFAAALFVCGRELARTGIHRRMGTGTAVLLLVLLSLVLFGTYSLNHGCLFGFAAECGTRWGPEFVAVMGAGEVGNVLLFFPTAFAGTLALLAASQLLNGNRLGNALAGTGRMTLAILLVNGIFLVFFRAWLGRHLDEGAVGVALILLSVCVQIVVAVPLKAPILALREAIFRFFQRSLLCILRPEEA